MLYHYCLKIFFRIVFILSKRDSFWVTRAKKLAELTIRKRGSSKGCKTLKISSFFILKLCLYQWGKNILLTVRRFSFNLNFLRQNVRFVNFGTPCRHLETEKYCTFSESTSVGISWGISHFVGNFECRGEEKGKGGKWEILTNRGKQKWNID